MLSIPSGAAFIAALVLVWRQSWANGSPLAWLHRPVLWALAGMIVSLLGTSESAITTSFCGSGARIRLVQCPYVSAVFYPQTVYNVLRLVGYVLMWVGARGMCHGHALHGGVADAVARRRASSAYGATGVVQHAPGVASQGTVDIGGGEGQPLLQEHGDEANGGRDRSEVRVPVRPFSAVGAPLAPAGEASGGAHGAGAAAVAARSDAYDTPPPGRPASRLRRQPAAQGPVSAAVGADGRVPASLWLAEGEVQDGGVLYTPVPAGVLTTTFPFS